MALAQADLGVQLCATGFQMNPLTKACEKLMNIAVPELPLKQISDGLVSALHLPLEKRIGANVNPVWADDDSGCP